MLNRQVFQDIDSFVQTVYRHEEIQIGISPETVNYFMGCPMGLYSTQEIALNFMFVLLLRGWNVGNTKAYRQLYRQYGQFFPSGELDAAREVALEFDGYMSEVLLFLDDFNSLLDMSEGNYLCSLAVANILYNTDRKLYASFLEYCRDYSLTERYMELSEDIKTCLTL